ncbi:MAG: hypothetical protein R2731_06715 [Nocardioides sp.]
MFELLVDDIVAVSTPGIALRVRVAAGTLRLGDRVTTAQGPGQAAGAVDLEVRHLSRNDTDVDLLAHGTSGLVTLVGQYGDVGPGFRLR